MTDPATDVEKLRDVVGTRSEADKLVVPPLVILEALEPYIPGEGGIAIERLGTGHSNETFKVSRDGVSLVLRRPPRPPTPPTAHDVIREFKILTALQGSGVPVPRPIEACPDSERIGVPFYLMELVEGVVIREEMPAALDNPEGRRRAVEEFTDTLVKVHDVSWRGTSIEELGKPTGYLGRQLRRWKGQWEHNQTRQVPEIEQIARWLDDHQPESQETTLVHGDYKLDNAIFAADPPVRLRALVDWEMSTLGDPLADLGLLSGTYVEAGDEPDRVLGFSSATAGAGALTRAEIVERYARASGRDVAHLRWYEVLALWKIAILLEGSYKRYLSGTTDDAFFALLKDGIPRVAAATLARVHAPGDP